MVDSDAIDVASAKLSMYVLATNTLDAQQHPSARLVTTYRAQGGAVERGFRFLKDPMFFAHGVYLKKPQRVMALMMIMTLSLLVYSLAERHLREALTSTQQTLPDQKGKPTQRTTMRRIFQMFEGLDMLTITAGSVVQRQLLNFKELHNQVVGLLPAEVKTLYALPGGCGT